MLRTSLLQMEWLFLSEQLLSGPIKLIQSGAEYSLQK